MTLPLMKSIAIDFDVVIKSSVQDGRRIIEFECSNSECDLEGDVILQKALMDSKDSFLRSGHLDLEHYS